MLKRTRRATLFFKNKFRLQFTSLLKIFQSNLIQDWLLKYFYNTSRMVAPWIKCWKRLGEFQSRSWAKLALRWVGAHPGLSRRDKGIFPEFSVCFLHFSVSFFNIFVLWALGWVTHSAWSCCFWITWCFWIRAELTLPYFSILPFPLHSAAGSVCRTCRKGLDLFFIFLIWAGGTNENSVLMAVITFWDFC